MDIDQDGILDVFSSSYFEGLFQFKGLGDGKYAERKPIGFADGVKKRFTGATGNFVDWDADGDLDLCVSEFHTTPDFQLTDLTKVYLNEKQNGKPAYNPEGTIIKTAKEGKLIHGFPSVIADWDADGKFDFIVTNTFNQADGVNGEYVMWYRNIGEKGAPKFAEGEYLIKPKAKERGPGKPGAMNAIIMGIEQKATELAHASTWPSDRWQISVADYNADGKLDILVGDMFEQRTERAKLTPEQEAKKKQLKLDYENAQKKVQEIMAEQSKYRQEQQAKGVDRREVRIPEELRKKMNAAFDEQTLIMQQREKYDTLERRQFGRVWIFLRK